MISKIKSRLSHDLINLSVYHNRIAIGKLIKLKCAINEDKLTMLTNFQQLECTTSSQFITNNGAA